MTWQPIFANHVNVVNDPLFPGTLGFVMMPACIYFFFFPYIVERYRLRHYGCVYVCELANIVSCSVFIFPFF